MSWSDLAPTPCDADNLAALRFAAFTVIITLACCAGLLWLVLRGW
jgi:hypothetical protein